MAHPMYQHGNDGLLMFLCVILVKRSMHLLTKSKVASRSTQLKEFHNKTQTGDNLSTWITKEAVSKANNEGFRCKYNGTIIC